MKWFCRMTETSRFIQSPIFFLLCRLKKFFYSYLFHSYIFPSFSLYCCYNCSNFPSVWLIKTWTQSVFYSGNQCSALYGHSMELSKSSASVRWWIEKWNSSYRLEWMCSNRRDLLPSFLPPTTHCALLRFTWWMELESSVSHAAIDLWPPAADQLPGSTGWFFFSSGFRPCHTSPLSFIIDGDLTFVYSLSWEGMYWRGRFKLEV